MNSKMILVIDDEVNFGKLIKMNVELSSEYHFMLATNGQEGLELIKRQKPDLVLLDIMMPGIDGFETLKRIKAIDAELPVAMLTAVWKEKEAQRCLGAGAYEYLTKPVDFDYLKTALLVKLL